MKFYFRAAAKNMIKTYQFILLRVVVGLVLAFGLIISVVTSIWLALTFDLTLAVPAIVVLLLVLSLLSYIIAPYLLYLIEGGHVAVLTQLITEGEVPTNQIRFGRRQVKANFTSVTGLFVLDLAIKRVLKQINAIINQIASNLTEWLASGGR